LLPKFTEKDPDLFFTLSMVGFEEESTIKESFDYTESVTIALLLREDAVGRPGSQEKTGYVHTTQPLKNKHHCLFINYLHIVIPLYIAIKLHLKCLYSSETFVFI
jgi:hypothetical protein